VGYYVVSLNLQCIEAKATTKSAEGSVPSGKNESSSESKFQFQMAKNIDL